MSSETCKFCGKPIMVKYRKWKACEPCGRKAKNAYQNARRAAERRCKWEGCVSLVATPYARYCAAHAPMAKQALAHQTKMMLMPVVGRAEKLRREKEPQAEAVAVPPSIRVTVCAPIAPSFRDYIGEAQERPYQRRSRSGAAW